MPSVDIECFEKVAVFFKGVGLQKAQFFSNTDAFAVLLNHDQKTGTFNKVGRTEVVQNSQNPEWPLQFTITYKFEEKQEFVVR